MGKWSAHLASTSMNLQTLKYRFRLSDADGDVCYEGLSNDGSSFAPLDDFGRGYAGAVAIEYLDLNTWRSL